MSQILSRLAECPHLLAWTLALCALIGELARSSARRNLDESGGDVFRGTEGHRAINFTGRRTVFESYPGNHSAQEP
jgi:hypothetical protein